MILSGSAAQMGSAATNSWGTWPVVITLFVAIISPLVTALINNSHQKKMKNLDVYTARRLDALQEYLATMSAMFHAYTHDEGQAYSRAYGKVLIFLPGHIDVKVQQLNELILEGDTDANDVKQLAHEVQRAIYDECITQKDKKILNKG